MTTTNAVGEHGRACLSCGKALVNECTCVKTSESKLYNGRAQMLRPLFITRPQFDSARAACRDLPPVVKELFFSQTAADQRAAARHCKGCPIQLDCAMDALSNETYYGVWGGLSIRQRNAILKKRYKLRTLRDQLMKQGIRNR